MRGFTATVAVLVVAASLVAAGGVAAVPSEAAADRAPAGDDRASTGDDRAADRSAMEPEDRAPPELPEQWRQTYGGDGDDIFSDLVRTDDGGYLLVGWTERETTEGWVMKVSGEGEREWERTLGGSGTDRFWGMAETDDGYLLAGRTDADGTTSGWIVELDADGEVQTERTAGSGAFNGVARDESGDDAGYLLAGWSNGGGQALKLDSNLSQEWQQSYAPPEGYNNGHLRAIVPAEGDGGYYLAGKVMGDSDDAWALKVDSEGNSEWHATAGGPNRDEAWAAAPAASNATDGGFVLAGETGVDTSDRSGWLIRFDADGNVAWERTPGDGALWFDSAMRTEDGYLFTGSGDGGPTGGTDGYVLHTDDEGAAEWEGYYGTGGWDKPWPAVRAHGGGYLLAGQTGGDGAVGKDGWLVRIGAESATAGENPGETDATASGADTTDSAIQDGTSTTASDPSSEGSVLGMGVGTALLALVGLLLLARR